MDSRNNNSNRDSELEEMIALSEMKDGKVHMCQVTNQFVADAQGSITVPSGYARQPGLPVTWEVTIDRHNLKAVADEITVPGTAYVNNGGELIDTMVKLYQVRIVGVLYFNIVLRGLRSTSADYSDCETAFTVFGSIPVNFIAGYVNDLANIRPDIIDNLIFGTIFELPDVYKNGVLFTFNPSDPEAFYSLFDGNGDVIFILPFQVTISSTPIIS